MTINWSQTLSQCVLIYCFLVPRKLRADYLSLVSVPLDFYYYCKSATYCSVCLVHVAFSNFLKRVLHVIRLESVDDTLVSLEHNILGLIPSCC